MKQKEIFVPYESMPQLHTGSFLTKEQAEQFKDCFKNIVAIIRCRDCKHRETIYCPFYQKYKGTKYDDWFCADGERKEGR